MPLAHKDTSLQTFSAALAKIQDGQHPTVTVKSEVTTITVSDPNGTNYGYGSNRRRFNTTEVEAILFTVTRPGFNPSYPVTLQALFVVESGRFVSAQAHAAHRSYGGQAVAANTKRAVSQPFGWRGNSLAEALQALENYTAAAIDANKAAEAERDREYAERQAEQARAKYEAAVLHIDEARHRAIEALGDAAATNAVLDFFLPYPTAPVSEG